MAHELLCKDYMCVWRAYMCVCVRGEGYVRV